MTQMTMTAKELRDLLANLKDEDIVEITHWAYTYSDEIELTANGETLARYEEGM